MAAIHPRLQQRDWRPLQSGEPLFWYADGHADQFKPAGAATHSWPVFINEAAYGEKHIALSLTQRERWRCEPEWAEALQRCLQQS